MCKHWDIKPMGVADDAIFTKSVSGTGSISLTVCAVMGKSEIIYLDGLIAFVEEAI